MGIGTRSGQGQLSRRQFVAGMVAGGLAPLWTRGARAADDASTVALYTDRYENWAGDFTFEGVPASGVTRARGAAVRAVSERLSRTFRASQVGSVRRALVVDDGRSAVTDNYLRVSLESPRQRNEWIDVVVA